MYLRQGESWKLIMSSLNMTFLPISHSCFRLMPNPSAYLMNRHFVILCKFWMIFGHFGKEIKLNWGKMKIMFWWICEIWIYSEECWWTPNSPLPTWGSLFSLEGRGVVNCLTVFPSHYNLNNSLLQLQIWLLFMFTPAIIREMCVVAKAGVDPALFKGVGDWMVP